MLEIRKARSIINHDPCSDPDQDPNNNNNGGGRGGGGDMEENCRGEECGERITRSEKKASFWCIMKIVWVKLVKNPNAYACIAGITWALIANR